MGFEPTRAEHNGLADKPTHTSGHILDLIIMRNSDTLLPTRPLTDYLFSDHITVM
jgi:hypothetical protein